MLGNRKLLLIILVGAAALVIGYAIFLYPEQRERGHRLKTEVTEMEALMKATQIQLSNSEAAVAEILGEDVPVYLRSEKTWNERRTRLIRDIDEWVRNTGVTLLKLEPKESEERLPLIRHPFHLEFEDGFQEICRFIQGLEQALKMVPEHWSLEATSQEGKEPILKASCRLVVYEWAGEVFTPATRKGGDIQPLQVASARDPFARWEEPTEPTPTRGISPSLKLTGILDFKGEPRAIINGRAYKVGDTLEGRRVISITQDEVAIEGESHPLKIERDLRVIPPS